MKLLTSFSLLAALVFSLCPMISSAQSGGKVIIVLDASGSMWGQIDGKPKIEIARETIGEILQTWNPDRQLGLIAYGHREKGSCEDIELLIEPGPVEQAAFLDVVNNIVPKGMTPLTDSVVQAAEVLKYTEEAASVILISDGLETCGKDPCDAAKQLAANGIAFKAHVVGFDLTEEERKSLLCISEETGGAFVAAGNAAELKEALETVIEVVEAPVEAAPPAPAPVEPAPAEPASGPGVLNITTLAAAEGEKVNSYFTIYEATQGVDGSRKRVTAGGGTQFELEPGDYFVSAKWGDVTASETVTIPPGEAVDLTIVMNGGVLRLKTLAAEGGEEVKGYYKIYEAKADLSGERKRVTAGAGTEFILPSGEYFVTSTWGETNESVSAVVMPGQMTSETIIANGGILNVSTSLTEGGEPVKGYYKIYEAKANLQGERRRVAAGAGGKFTLPAGDYRITSDWGEATGISEATVTAGAAADSHIVVSAGVLTVKVVDANGAAVKGYHSISESAPNLEGNRKRVTAGAGNEYKLPAGTYLISSKAGDLSGQVDGVTLKAGETVEALITVE